MSMHRILVIIAAILAQPLLATDRPNILFIYADDLL